MGREGFTLEDNIREVARQYPLLYADVDGDKQDDAKGLQGINLGDGVKQIFLNPAQLLAHNFGSRSMAVCGGRGLGKTTFEANRLHNCVATLPRATGALFGATIKQVFAILMPNLVKSLETFGIVEGRDFVRGKPNARWKWDKPFAIPRRWENVISFINGNILMCISTNSYAPANGLNLSYSLMDEARYANWRNYVESVRPAIRGEVYDHPGYRRNENPFYLSEAFFSDGGVIKKQQEWECMENDQTEDINELICEKLAQLKYAEEYDEANKANGHYTTDAAWQLSHAPKYVEQMKYLRCQSRVFFRFSSLHNASILGMQYINDRKRDMPDLLYRVQILGQKATLDKSQRFYPNFDMDIHGYTPNQSAETDLIYNKYQSKHTATVDLGAYNKTYDYEAPDLQELGAVGGNCSLDVDMQPGKPLFIAHDYNSNVNTVVTAQAGKMDGVESAIILSSMFVKNPKMLEDLMEKWHNYYAPHQYSCKDVVLYYDSTAKQGRSYATRAGNDEQYFFYNVIRRVLTDLGWNVIMVDMGNPMLHGTKFEFINACFAGKERYFPRINAIRNDYLVASLENSMTTMKMGHIHKYKEPEKRKNGVGMSDDEELGANNYTDMSDAFDNIMRGLCKFGMKERNAWSGGSNAWGRNRWGRKKW